MFQHWCPGNSTTSIKVAGPLQDRFCAGMSHLFHSYYHEWKNKKIIDLGKFLNEVSWVFENFPAPILFHKIILLRTCL